MRIQSILFVLALVFSGCGSGSAANPCPNGDRQHCFGTAQDTCYCGDHPSKFTYCHALLNYDPTNPVSTCAPYRGLDAPCHSDSDCATAAGCYGSVQSGGCPNGLTCGSHYSGPICIHKCNTDAQCPDGYTCAIDSGWGECY